MIGSHATSRALPDGGYHGVYKPFYTKDQSFVLGKDGNKRVFREAYEAEAIAWRTCKRVERDHLNYLRLDPSQIPPAPAKAKHEWASIRLRQAMKEAEGA